MSFSILSDAIRSHQEKSSQDEGNSLTLTKIYRREREMSLVLKDCLLIFPSFKKMKSRRSKFTSNLIEIEFLINIIVQ